MHKLRIKDNFLGKSVVRMEVERNRRATGKIAGEDEEDAGDVQERGAHGGRGIQGTTRTCSACNICTEISRSHSRRLTIFSSTYHKEDCKRWRRDSHTCFDGTCVDIK